MTFYCIIWRQYTVVKLHTGSKKNFPTVRIHSTYTNKISYLKMTIYYIMNVQNTNDNMLDEKKQNHKLFYKPT
ncbi:hypothetical protein XELAEV_18015108mg [Xenopus laevis]|uniref:Uncharacterized protein n=1 Tax=Xenopus laevis TaxID=8355 RepID=A0A974DJ86_XENLA|nr:hypothetical protein XELAEV_18015108mg [Xenopus laevis]